MAWVVTLAESASWGTLVATRDSRILFPVSPPHASPSPTFQPHA